MSFRPIARRLAHHYLIELGRALEWEQRFPCSESAAMRTGDCAGRAYRWLEIAEAEDATEATSASISRAEQRRRLLARLGGA
jgi:hypothetical protein